MHRGFVAFVVAGLLQASVASAQPLGTFRWQLQPYCNVVALSVTQTGSVYTLDGFDDQCGTATVAPLTGTAVPNPDGTIELGLNIVTSPGSAPLHIAVPLNLGTLGGPWKDSAGHTGAFVFTLGAGTGGSPRPAVLSGVPAGSIGTAEINPTQVQLRIEGSCATGQAVQRINQDGTVVCAAAAAVGITSVQTPAGSGLQGTVNGGAATLSLRKTSAGAFDLSNFFGFTARGGFGNGSIPDSGPGTRAMWYPRKAAFRAGVIEGSQWDDANVGDASVAFGLSTTASGGQSFAMGDSTVASGAHAFAMGDSTVASGGNSFVAGALSSATAFESVAMGLRVSAGGNGSVALGTRAVALPAAHGSFVFADRSAPDDNFTSFAPNEFVVRAAGGVGFYTNAATNAGAELPANGSQWLQVSDANLKENFRDLDGQDVLAKLARMPIREWNYKAQDAAIRHVGPTAQDFHAAFGLGENPLRIGTLDADGIALAGVQALEARTREQHDAVVRQNEALRAEIASLRARLDRLEAKER